MHTLFAFFQSLIYKQTPLIDPWGYRKFFLSLPFLGQEYSSFKTSWIEVDFSNTVIMPWSGDHENYGWSHCMQQDFNVNTVGEG